MTLLPYLGMAFVFGLVIFLLYGVPVLIERRRDWYSEVTLKIYQDKAKKNQKKAK